MVSLNNKKEKYFLFSLYSVRNKMSNYYVQRAYCFQGCLALQVIAEDSTFLWGMVGASGITLANALKQYV